MIVLLLLCRNKIKGLKKSNVFFDIHVLSYKIKLLMVFSAKAIIS